MATIFDEAAVVVFPYTATTGSSGVLHQAGSYGKAVVMPDLGDLAETKMISLRERPNLVAKCPDFDRSLYTMGLRT